MAANEGLLPVNETTRDPAWRTLQTFGYARVLVAIGLLMLVAAFGASLFGRDPVGTPPSLLAGISGYLVFAILAAAAALYWRRQFRLQTVGQLLIDLTIVTALVAIGGGIRSGLVTLYLLPLAGASLLLPVVATYFFCSLAVIAILVDTLLRNLGASSSESQLFQAGIFGVALFGITMLLSLLAGRLAWQERLVQSRSRDLENQLDINRLVIAQMEQGVIVVDASGKVRANNRAARRLLGLASGAQLTGRSLRELTPAAGLAQAFQVWLGDEPRRGWSNSSVQTSGRGTASTHAMPELQVRARFARPSSPDSEEFVIFLEDVRAVEERAQQLKLASMGRLTASIAHEIRNPLAAISHAGQLIAEDARDPLQGKLAAIVRENTRRLDRLVDDVLRVARREPPQGDEFDLGEFVAGWLAEFLRDRSLAGGVIAFQAQGELRVHFEITHLRQVMFNLIDNALRYASGKPGSVVVRIERGSDSGGRARLWVFDDGPGVAADIRTALFEPFYTTHARGTGLGLYLAREFCIANRGDLAFDGLRELDGSTRNGFVIRFPRMRGVQPDEAGFLDTMPVR